MISLKLLISSLLLPTVAFGSIASAPSQEVPGFKLQLEQEFYLTDKTGVILLEQLIKAPIGKLVVIYRPDGFCYKGMVTEIREEDGKYAVYGKINNVEETSFGFVMVKGGTFAGAIVERKNEKTFVVDFNLDQKGFIFVRSTRHDKPVI